METDQSPPPGINLVKLLPDKYYLESSNESPQVPEFGDLEISSALESDQVFSLSLLGGCAASEAKTEDLI